MASLLDRVLHKHKAKSTAELVARTGAALEKCGIVEGGAAGGAAGAVPRTGSGDGAGLASGMPPSPASEKWMDEVGRLLGTMKVRRRGALEHFSPALFFFYFRPPPLWVPRGSPSGGLVLVLLAASTNTHAPPPLNTPLSQHAQTHTPSLSPHPQIALFGDGDAVAPSKETAQALAADACAAGLPERLIDALPALEFEARKDAAQVRVYERERERERE